MMTVGNSIKIILGLFATILLGAIGSGVWEKLLSPGLRELSNIITNILSSISTTYSDSIYSSASNIMVYDHSGSIVLLLFLIVFIGLFIYALDSKKENSKVGLLHKAMVEQYRGWQGIISSGALLVLLTFMMATDTTVSEIKRYSLKNMEITRPFIGEHEYLMLKSRYLRMKNEDDFKLFLESLYAVSSKEKLEIEKYKIN